MIKKLLSINSQIMTIFVQLNNFLTLQENLEM